MPQTFAAWIRNSGIKRRELRGFFVFIIITFLARAVFGQQMADPTFDAKVARPAYITSHPKILFDEAHNNFHKSTERYKPFADLITNDGFSVTPIKKSFEAKSLAGYDILVIANALGAEEKAAPETSQSAFTDQECDAVREWVNEGGALLLIADHAPFGAAAEKLARRFGVDMSKGHTSDPNNHDTETGIATFLVFSRDNRLLRDHAITRGRGATEQINNVLTFTGQSLKGPKGIVAFLKLSDTASDRLPTVAQSQGNAPGSPVSAAGRAQGIAFSFGKGRVVVLGEAAMLSAQVVRGSAATMMQKEDLRIGMNRKETDNRQLTLNIMHWLSQLLK